ncbi:PREDICTED: ras guanine nucleotide exchange factor Q-like [Camelina sativa]|uniref:Ras guanine nucleotide exchange factor Q-like n=1 Tax=Camelina sativa TaxID=90675 RepID=A0ABM0UMQ6_CAMSA|nr:PREDICTED: ras guanine nucleotide exchange factor Q-like [Camelina sativa]
MGTKTGERIRTNPLGLKSVDRSGFISFGVNGRGKSSKDTLTDDKEEEQGGVSIIRSMDRFLEKQNAESIRHTMQAQEDTFKQQVRELHRVYNTQKMMMNQLKHRSQYWTVDNNKDQTGSRERTGSCSGIDLENVVRATQTTTDHIEESELELTLSIGLSSSSTTMTTTTNKDMDYSSTTSLRSSSDNCNNQSNNNNNNSNNNQESSGPNTPMSSSSTTSLDREKKRPHWLFQGLSINRTSS